MKRMVAVLLLLCLFVGCSKSPPASSSQSALPEQAEQGNTYPAAFAKTCGIQTLCMATNGAGCILSTDRYNEFYYTADITDAIDVAIGADHVVIARQDGTVKALGSNEKFQCEVEEWTDIIEVCAGDGFSAGLESDGSVVVASGFEPLANAVEGWENIAEIAAGKDFILGLTADGRAVSANTGEIDSSFDINSAGWANISQISACMDMAAALTKDGLVLAAGSLGSKLYNDIATWSNIESICAGTNHLYAISSGKVLCAGEEDAQSTGLAAVTDALNVFAGEDFAVVRHKDNSFEAFGNTLSAGMDSPYLLDLSDFNDASDEFSTPVQLSSSILGAFAVTSDGKIAWAKAAVQAQDQLGQLGDWSRMVSVSANEKQIIGLDADGKVHLVTIAPVLSATTGSDNWENVSKVVAGYMHAAAMTSDGKALSGGIDYYGECLLENWSDLIDIGAGKYFTVGLRKDGSLLLAGKFDADLSGIDNVKAIAVSNSTVALLMKDGTVAVYGNNDKGQCNTQAWSNIKAISASDTLTVGITSDNRALCTDGFTYQNTEQAVCGQDSFYAIKNGNAYLCKKGEIAKKASLYLTKAMASAPSEAEVTIDPSLVKIWANDEFTVAVNSDGTIEGTRMMPSWVYDYNGNIAKVAQSLGMAFILTKDGYIYGEVTFRNPGIVEPFSEHDFVDVATGHTGQVVGVHADGSISIKGYEAYTSDISGWSDIVSVVIDTSIFGLKTDGSMEMDDPYFFYDTNYTGIRKISVEGENAALLMEDGTIRYKSRLDNAIGFDPQTNSYGPLHSGWDSVSTWTDIVDIAVGWGFIVACDSQGNAYIAGKMGDGTTISVEGWKDIVAVSAGQNHIVGLKSDGTLIATGDNWAGQCDVGDWQLY